ncbi:MAG: alkaline phosphatase family protein [bacterium]
MRSTRWTWVLWLTTLVILPITVGSAATVPVGAKLRPVHHVIIMSFDGLRGDAARMVIPPSMLAQAAFTWTARTTLPSSTLPSHTSMLTGVPPSVHGVRINPDFPRGHIAISTVFSVVTASGGRAAAFVAKPKLLYLVRPGTAARAEYVPYPKNDMADVARQAARYLAVHQPRLLFIHVADPDDQGHRHGWMSPPYLTTVRRIPETVGVILDVLRRMGRLDDSLVIVTADHGGHGRTHGSDRPDDMTIPWVAFGAVEPGPISKPVATYDTAATAIAALGMQIPATWQGAPVLQTVEKVR